MSRYYKITFYQYQYSVTKTDQIMSYIFVLLLVARGVAITLLFIRLAYAL